MESLESLEEMRRELELLEEEEGNIDIELNELIKQQPDLLVKGWLKLIILNIQFMLLNMLTEFRTSVFSFYKY